MCIIIILILALFTGCSAETQAVSLNIDCAAETERTLYYNVYIEAYNVITENMFELIGDYQRVCGFSDKTEYSNKSFSFNFDEAFYSVLEKPLSNKAENAFEKKYRALYESIEPLVKSFNNSVQYYNRELNKNITELNFLHGEFLISYVRFKNAYTEFGKDIFFDYEKYKYEELKLLSNLTIHSDFCRLIIISQEITQQMEDTVLKQNVEDNLEANVMEFKSLLIRIKAYKEKDYFKYGLDTEKLAVAGDITAAAAEIERDLDYLVDFLIYDINNEISVTKISLLTADIISKTDNMILIYNSFV